MKHFLCHVLEHTESTLKNALVLNMLCKEIYLKDIGNSSKNLSILKWLFSWNVSQKKKQKNTICDNDTHIFMSKQAILDWRRVHCSLHNGSKRRRLHWQQCCQIGRFSAQLGYFCLRQAGEKYIGRVNTIWAAFVHIWRVFNIVKTALSLF